MVEGTVDGDAVLTCNWHNCVETENSKRAEGLVVGAVRDGLLLYWSSPPLEARG